jgi:aryl-alcohol dehydrogenase-like predicted oxidoreductase
MEHRPLGTSGIEVSRLALGSWRTFERISREQGVAVMAAARASGIDFLDDARYDDETGTAPLSTGYSEVVFGEVFRATGWKRDEVVVANKLWWEFWPQQSAVEELDGSLRRMGFDHFDLVYAAEPPGDLSVDEAVGAISELIEAGKVRAWGILNWEPEALAEIALVVEAGRPAPCAAQLPYSLAFPQYVEGEAMGEALDAVSADVIASFALAGGALTGKYLDPSATGRLSDRLDDARLQDALRVGERLAALAPELDATPAGLAIAFALSSPRVASVLFGATRPEHVVENVAGLTLANRLGDEELARLRALAP